MELKELQANMTQWKDLTAQRLAEKFQEELQLQVERYDGQFILFLLGKKRLIHLFLSWLTLSPGRLKQNYSPVLVFCLMRF